MYCQKCGKQIPEDSKWCPLCGGRNDSINWEKLITIITCFCCLLAAVFFFVAGWCSIRYILQATYFYTAPLDFLVTTVTWIAFGMSAICFCVFGILLMKYRKHH